MPNLVTPSFSQTLVDESSSLGGQICESAAQVKERVSDFGRKAADTIDDNLASAATGLDTAAAKLHETAESFPGVDRVRGVAHTAADTLSATAGYVREHNVSRTSAEFRTLVTKNLNLSLLTAGAIGFLLGRSLMKKHRS